MANESRPHIVVLDGHTLNPGDLSWAELEALGHCDIFPRTEPAERVARAQSASIVLTNKVVLDGATLRQLPELKFISILATGTNVVDLVAAAQQGVTVANVPAYSTASVAQATFALLLELVQHTSLHNRSVHAGEWSRQVDFSYSKRPTLELAGLTLGLVGYGEIGQRVARIAEAFGLQVLVTTRSPHPELGDRQVALATLLQKSDIVSLHCPLTPETHTLLNADRIDSMKSGAILINTSRGGLIDEAALTAALEHGKLAAAGLDVLTDEPPGPKNPLLHARNCLITPHIAWATGAARQRLLNATVENVRAFLAGTPRRVVSTGR